MSQSQSQDGSQELATTASYETYLRAFADVDHPRTGPLKALELLAAVALAVHARRVHLPPMEWNALDRSITAMLAPPLPKTAG